MRTQYVTSQELQIVNLKGCLCVNKELLLRLILCLTIPGQRLLLVELCCIFIESLNDGTDMWVWV